MNIKKIHEEIITELLKKIPQACYSKLDGRVFIGLSVMFYIVPEDKFYINLEKMKNADQMAKSILAFERDAEPAETTNHVEYVENKPLRLYKSQNKEWWGEEKLLKNFDKYRTYTINNDFLFVYENSELVGGVLKVKRK